MNTGTICQWKEISGNRTGALIKADGESKEVHLSARNFKGDINSLKLEQRVEFEVYELRISPGILHAKNCRLLETTPTSSTTNAVSIPTDENLSSEDTRSAAPEPDSEESQTHLILTVGTNALPVWVAWYHLKPHLCNPKVGFIYTPETENRKKRLEQYCGCENENSINIPATSPGQPQTVQGTINNMLNGLPNDPNIHVHYTGGTQVMGVETVSTITTQRKAVQRSYLDARSGSSPIIVDRNGNQIGPADAREGICPDIEKIAKLNGFEFKSAESDSPEAPDMKDAGKIISFAGTSNEWLKCAAWTALKSSLKRIARADAKRGNYTVLRDVTISPEERGSNDIELDVVAVLGYQVIVISCSTLLHEKKKGQTEKGTSKKKGDVKMEAMRAYHQAKQLGGDEARAIILCGLDKNMAKTLQNELHHDIGSEDVPLQVWGNNTWNNLEKKFDAYLKNDLIWRAASETASTQVADAKLTPATPHETVASPCQTQNLLLLTVGTNALPIWVAWCHLKEKPENSTVGFIYTEKTRKTMERLKKNFKYNGTTNFLYVPLSAPGNPKVIGDAINRMLNGLPNDSNIHVHYTGGTQVMGVETVSTITTKLATQGKAVKRSYLDAQSESTPQIVDANGTVIKHLDARQGICPDIKNIAKLNGFEVFGENPKRKVPPPIIDPKDFAPDNLDVSEQKKLQGALKKVNDKNKTVGREELEYAALAALKHALEEIKGRCSQQAYKRDNYAIFQSVYVRKKKVEESDEPEPFELDVVAVLGYQIIVVSCTTTSDESVIREKAAEVYLRAQQLGGDEARTIMLCSVSERIRQRLETELKDDTGSKDEPLQVWGKKKWYKLSYHFKEYLKDLGWK